MAKRTKLDRAHTSVWRIDGLEELADSLERLGDLPKKHVRAAARAGANIALRAVRELAPVYVGEFFQDTVQPGSLKKGIIKKEERSKCTGKAVFDIMPDPKKNDIFAVYYKGTRYYYPASVEYGYVGLDGQKHPGQYFMKNGIEVYQAQIKDESLNMLSARIDQEWAKKGG